jgi:hypothetical protein
MANKPKRTTRNQKAWRDGFNAGRRLVAPKHETRNPYPPGSDEAFTWISGFIEGKTKPPQAIKD